MTPADCRESRGNGAFSVFMPASCSFFACVRQTIGGNNFDGCP